MAFNVPQFNLQVDYFAAPVVFPIVVPPAGAPFVQLYQVSRLTFPSLPGNVSLWNDHTEIRMSFADFVLFGPTFVGSVFRVNNDGAGNVWLWRVAQWEFRHLGFPNQYIGLSVFQVDATSGNSPDAQR